MRYEKYLLAFSVKGHAVKEYTLWDAWTAWRILMALGIQRLDGLKRERLDAFAVLMHFLGLLFGVAVAGVRVWGATA